MKAVLIFLAAWALFMAFALRGDEYEYPFPHNIGGEWLKLHGQMRVRLLKSTRVYLGAPSSHRWITSRWQAEMPKSAGAGLCWKVEF